MLLCCEARETCYNDNSALIPELWAQEALAFLESNVVMPGLVNRQFDSQIAKFGDTVHAHRPAEMRIRRKGSADSLVHQSVSSADVPVKLDQWFTASFIIKDDDLSMSFKDLVALYLHPAMVTISDGVDRSILGKIHKYFGTPTERAGRLAAMDANNSYDFVLEAAEKMNVDKAPLVGRNILMTPATQTAFLKNTLFVEAQKRGDGGSALENALLGQIAGFNTYMAHNVPGIFTGADTVLGAVNNDAQVAGYAADIDTTISSYEAIVGEFVNIAGNDQPTYLTARTASTNTTSITLNEALKYGVTATAVITVYKACKVKGDYAQGYTKGIVLDGWGASKAPQVGQLVAFDDGTRHTYTIIESELTASGEQTVLLDRPLEIAIGNDDDAFPGPYGSFNWAFHRNSIALVTRPLVTPPSMSGAMSAVSSYNGLGLRVSMQYQLNETGLAVNVDLLSGVAVLDERLAVPLLG